MFEMVFLEVARTGFLYNKALGVGLEPNLHILDIIVLAQNM